MNEDRKESLIEQEDRNMSKRSRLLKVVVALVGFTLLVIGAFITFLQLNSFDRVQAHMSGRAFAAETASTMTYGKDGYSVLVPNEVIAGSLSAIVSETLEERPATLQHLFYDGTTRRADMNLTLMGFYVPVSTAISIEEVEGALHLEISDYRLGKEGLTSPGLVALLSGLSDSKQVVSLSDYGVPEGLGITELAMVPEGLQLNFQVDEDMIHEEIEKIRRKIDPVSISYYRSFEEERTEPVLAIAQTIYPLNSRQVASLVDDARKGQYLINDLLLLTEGYDMTQLNEKLAVYGVSVDSEKIIMERKGFKGQAIDPDIASLFMALDTHFGEEIMAFNGGKPFDMATMSTMTVAALAEAYDLGINPETVDRLSFVYEDEFKVAYKLDGDSYYIRSIDDYEVVNREAYEALDGSKSFVAPYYVDDIAMWDMTVDTLTQHFEAEELFVRYMKTDGKSIFAVVSTASDPQDYWSSALMMSELGVVKLLQENVRSIPALMAAHPEFNIETATREVETSDYERISEDTHATIMDELFSRRMISRSEEVTIDYSSYDGNTYIAFKLSNDDEYVFKVENTVYGTYLATVYTKERALRNWRDLPEILLLQDPPDRKEE